MRYAVISCKKTLAKCRICGYRRYCSLKVETINKIINPVRSKLNSGKAFNGVDAVSNEASNAPEPSLERKTGENGATGATGATVGKTA